MTEPRDVDDRLPAYEPPHPMRETNGTRRNPYAPGGGTDVDLPAFNEDAYFSGTWDPMDTDAGYAGDLDVLKHPAYALPTRFQGKDSEEMGF